MGPLSSGDAQVRRGGTKRKRDIAEEQLRAFALTTYTALIEKEKDHYFYRLTPSLTIQDEFDFGLTSTTVDDFEPSSPRALFPDPGHTGMDVGTAPTGMFDLINLYSLLTLLLKINYKKDIDGLFPVGYFSQKMSNSDTGYAPL
jgi:hypothetical protein